MSGCIAMTFYDALLILWITFAGVAVLGIAAALVWAVRSGQFSGQDRARRLPLESGIPEDTREDGLTQRPQSAQRED